MPSTRFAATLALLFAGCSVVPGRNVHPADSLPPLDYTSDDLWAALPDRDDPADALPEGATDGQGDAAVDVFFIHPTTYYNGADWNQPIDFARANDLTDSAVMRNQASVFNASARVFAPRYRQATLYTFLNDHRLDESADALSNAHRDVNDAFDELLRRIGDRPFLIAGHSQGAYHAHRLLTERISGTPLLERMVAAYVIGYAVPVRLLAQTVPDIPLCDSATSTRCMVQYLTAVEGTSIEPPDPMILHTPGGFTPQSGDVAGCVNPLRWTTDTTRAEADQHLGAVEYDDDASDLTGDVTTNLTWARCNAGVLEVQSGLPGYAGLAGNLHTKDYSLFAMDLRANATQRIDAFLAARL